MVGSHSMCMINFPLRASPIDTELLKKMVYENTRNYINQRAQGKESNQYWIVPDAKGIAVSSMSCRQFMRQEIYCTHWYRKGDPIGVFFTYERSRYLYSSFKQ
ncbi:hypothetical protein I3679_005265 [Proteus mirabilis]|uniref:Uncharacterized protein n=1 Tax=Proteus mirabilis TaxID=584 RepID=A0ABD5LYZ2_PROMI